MKFSHPMQKLLLLITLGLSLELATARQVPNFAAANLVLGQTDFTTAALPPTSISSLRNPSGIAVDPSTGKVFVADSGNNRVLRYANAAALLNGASAERVFGQPGFSTPITVDPPTASSLKAPTALWLDSSGRLWVADTGNNRVLIFPGAATGSTNGPSATTVLGQPDAVTGTAISPPSAASLSSPEGLCIDAGGRLWVADKNNHRVLKYNNAAGKSTGGNADGEFGQDQGAPFTSSVSGSDNLHFNGPAGVAVDASGILWVADRGNNRIMGFPSAATISNGANGARILGQPDYNSGSNMPGLSASAISGPSNLFVDAANNLWVSDQGNNRALRFANITSIDNGRPAAGVIGQPDFVSGSPGLDARLLDTNSAAGFAGVFVLADGTLWISDFNNHRVLRYATADSDAPTVAIKGKRKVKTTKARILVQGTASDDSGVASVTLQIKKKRLPATGTTVWRRKIPLKLGRNTVWATATDVVGKTSAPAKVVITRKVATAP